MLNYVRGPDPLSTAQDDTIRWCSDIRIIQFHLGCRAWPQSGSGHGRHRFVFVALWLAPYRVPIVCFYVCCEERGNKEAETRRLFAIRGFVSNGPYW